MTTQELMEQLDEILAYGHEPTEEQRDSIRHEYKNNKRFRDYVDKYCKKRKIEVAEALKHEVVKQAYLYYAEEIRNPKR